MLASRFFSFSFHGTTAHASATKQRLHAGLGCRLGGCENRCLLLVLFELSNPDRAYIAQGVCPQSSTRECGALLVEKQPDSMYAVDSAVQLANPNPPLPNRPGRGCSAFVDDRACVCSSLPPSPTMEAGLEYIVRSMHAMYVHQAGGVVSSEGTEDTLST